MSASTFSSFFFWSAYSCWSVSFNVFSAAMALLQAVFSSSYIFLISSFLVFRSPFSFFCWSRSFSIASALSRQFVCVA